MHVKFVNEGLGTKDKGLGTLKNENSNTRRRTQ